MIFFFTDFGASSFYTGQMRAAVLREVQDISIVDLCNDVPAYDIRASAHLLAAVSSQFQRGDIVVVVVDPDVGTTARIPVVLLVDEVWFVGPNNGVFDILLSRAKIALGYEITWRPSELSNSFHGRDLFAPVAAFLARKENIERFCRSIGLSQPNDREKEDSATIIYFDHYGNALSGLRARLISNASTIVVNNYKFSHANVFADVKTGEGFWYSNSLGLVEVSVNRGSAKNQYALKIGDVLRIE